MLEKITHRPKKMQESVAFFIRTLVNVSPSNKSCPNQAWTHVEPVVLIFRLEQCSKAKTRMKPTISSGKSTRNT